MEVDLNNYEIRRGYLTEKKTKEKLHRQVYFRAYPTHNLRWHVHHIDGNKLNNSLENLILLSPRTHMELHKAWPICKLPSREQIEKWLVAVKSSGFIKPREAREVKRLKKLKEYRRREKRAEKKRIRKKNQPKLFTPTVILRKKEL